VIYYINVSVIKRFGSMNTLSNKKRRRNISLSNYLTQTNVNRKKLY